mmetsp:Transcript_41912/g.61581  ORF Transcript_41912/g.61581 Transcript_41912/m.61581 type:complete len:128 (-) Transcript_41912:1521-1904(-)
MRHGESGRSFSFYRIQGLQVEGTSWGLKVARKIHGLQVEGTSWGIKEANSVKAVGGMSTEGPGVSDNGMPFTAAHQDDDIMPSNDSALWVEVVGLPSIQPQIGVHKMYVMKCGRAARRYIECDDGST